MRTSRKGYASINDGGCVAFCLRIDLKLLQRRGHLVRMQEAGISFPTMGSPNHRFTFSHSYDTDLSESCSQVPTPFVSAPSSPGRHCDGGFYFSAPASPHWAHTFTESMACNYPSSVPLHWDEHPRTPRRRSNGKDEAASFLMTSEFEFSARFAELDNLSISPTPMSAANELFCNGQIKPLGVSTRVDDPTYSRSSVNMEEHDSVVTTLPYVFEFHSRGGCPEVSECPMSTPRSPCFPFALGGIDASPRRVHEVNEGRSVSSLSAPQLPLSPINRVKGALCGVSPCQINRAFDTSMHIPMEVSREAFQNADRVEEPFDTSVHMSLEGFRHHARRCSRRSDWSARSGTLGSEPRGHRRTRSFSPLRLFHRGEHTSSSSPVEAMHREDSTDTSWRELSANVKKQEDGSSWMAKSLNMKRTLKDLLHWKSGGENRSRWSGALVDSTLSMDRMGSKRLSAGRSSSESSRSSISSSVTNTKDVSMAKSGSRGRTQGGDESMNNPSNANGISKKGGLKQTINEAKGNNDKTRGMFKPKSSSQMGMKGNVQKGNIEKGCISPHEMHYMMHKAQSEELRKRTFLPYRQGLLGCLGFTSKSYRTVSSISKTLQSVSG